MSDERKNKSNKRSISGALASIISVKRTAPWFVFVLLIVIYLVTTVSTVRTSVGGGVIAIGQAVIPKAALTGVYSTIANMCLIILVVLFRNIGFYSAMGILVTQFPFICVNIFVLHSFTSIPGWFTNLLTMIVCILIFTNQRRALAYQQRIVEQAVTDVLTGLPNRFAGREYLSGLIKTGTKFVYVAADINDFKNINDTMGYEVGNRILIEIANRWRDLADSGRAGTYNLVAHVSGDEFGICIQEYGSEEDVLKTIQAYKTELERKITIDDYDYYVNASFGYAEYPVDSKVLEDLIAKASLTLHDAKRKYSEGVIVRYTDALRESEKTLKIERKIREALESDSVFFHLQPQYDITHKLRGFEALARMKDADGKFISPMEFIAVSEKTGLVDQIDMCVFRKAAKFLEDAAKNGRTDITISVNISVKHLLKNNFLEDIKSILDTYEISPEQLEIEITESVMVESVERARTIIEQVKSFGIRVAIDDFGTGYSSLSYLNNFPANLLKIDKSFIDEINKGESSQKYVQSIISIGHVLGMEVISEGVETEEQLEILKNIDCDLIQGFIWGKPLPPDEAKNLL